MTSIFTNISSISTVSFPHSPGVTRCRKRLMDTERSAWTEISIRTGWIWVIRRGPGRSLYTVSRAYNNGRSCVEDLLTSASKDSSFVLPLWSMSRTMGTMTCILINSDDETAGYRGPFPGSRYVFLERGRKEFFLRFPPKFRYLLRFPFRIGRLFQVFLLCLDSFHPSHVNSVMNKNCESISRDEFTIGIIYILIGESFYVFSFFQIFSIFSKIEKKDQVSLLILVLYCLIIIFFNL